MAAVAGTGVRSPAFQRTRLPASKRCLSSHVHVYETNSFSKKRGIGVAQKNFNFCAPPVFRGIIELFLVTVWRS